MQKRNQVSLDRYSVLRTGYGSTADTPARAKLVSGVL